ncbi:sodium Bile acid symporter family [Striga asiatica]|uniref:Sodium Bile acid symporter family n=1 Tax=Striga asiatica TaxID=4170 RepID=A0A5A7QQP4_STRAF|nr:sodium Bile acid symporter family [Striga asiatica]
MRKLEQFLFASVNRAVKSIHTRKGQSSVKKRGKRICQNTLRNQNHTTRKDDAAATNTAQAAARATVSHPRISQDELATATSAAGGALGGSAFLGGGGGGGDGGSASKNLRGSSTLPTSYTASWSPAYTALPTDAFVYPVVMFAPPPLPAAAVTGLLTVSNCDGASSAGTTWNWINSIFRSSESELRAPDFRSENAASVGAKTVRAWLESLSCVWIWSATLVLFSRRMKVVKWPAFARMAVRSGGPDGAGPGAAAGVWAEVG